MKSLLKVSLGLWLAISMSVFGAELQVPSEYPTIQAGIDAAENGDTVVVAVGIYTDTGNRDIDFGGKAITVRSTEPNDANIVAATIIDCNGTSTENHRGFYFHSGETELSIVVGITVKNGFYSGDKAGGAIFISGQSSPKITNCNFNNNKSYPMYRCTILCDANCGPTFQNAI